MANNPVPYTWADALVDREIGQEAHTRRSGIQSDMDYDHDNMANAVQTIARKADQEFYARIEARKRGGLLSQPIATTRLRP
jgi:hypothetical protein